MREKLIVVSADATTTTECVWAGQTLVAERVSETRAPGGRLQTTTTDYRYLYGPSGLPLELIVTPENGTPVSYAYQCDRAGSVIALTDATGAAVATYTYDPWGALLEAPEDGIGERNPLRYRGYYFDTSTGLYYLPARYYDPATARFLSPDPAAPSTGEPLSLNRYAYCVGDPVNHDDPTGAVIVQGSGVTTRVSEDALVFARRGQLAAAKEIQSRYRESVAANYAKGYDFKYTGQFAESEAGWLADGLQAQLGDGTSYGRLNMNWRRSREHGFCMMEGVSSWTEVNGELMRWGFKQNGATRLAGEFQVAGYLFDAGLFVSTLWEWWQGEATPGDLAWSAFAFVSGASTAELAIDIGLAFAEADGGYDFGWAKPY